MAEELRKGGGESISMLIVEVGCPERFAATLDPLPCLPAFHSSFTNH